MSGTALLDVHSIGSGATGNETWARCVLQALESDDGPRYDVCATRSGAEHLPASVSAGRVAVVSGSSARRLLVDLPGVIRARRPAAVIAQYTLPRTSTPGVVAVHDLSFDHAESKSWIPRHARLRYRATVRDSIRRAKAVLVPTEWTRNDLLSRYDISPDRVFVAPCAVDPALAASLSGARRHEAPVRNEVLCVGTVLPRKNLSVVAKAVSRLRKEGLDVNLRLVGPVPEAGKGTLAELRLLLGDGLVVSGAVSASGLIEAYDTAAVLAYPSRFEGFGIPLLEAMCAGLPVVASTATCLPEVAGEAALLVGPDDVAGWTSSLASAISDPATRAQLRSAGLQRQGTYAWSATASVVRAAVGRALAS